MKTVAETSNTELNFRGKEREVASMKAQFNQLNHKFDILKKEKEYSEQRVQTAIDNYEQLKETNH